jgi:hypothetical protein
MATIALSSHHPGLPGGGARAPLADLRHNYPLPTGAEDRDELRRVPVRFLRIECDRCGKVQMGSAKRTQRGPTSRSATSGCCACPRVGTSGRRAEPMPSRAGDTAARGECCDLATVPTALRLKLQRLQTFERRGTTAAAGWRGRRSL